MPYERYLVHNQPFKGLSDLQMNQSQQNCHNDVFFTCTKEDFQSLPL